MAGGLVTASVVLVAVAGRGTAIIAFKELFALIVAAAIWGYEWQDTGVVLVQQ